MHLSDIIYLSIYPKQLKIFQLEVLIVKLKFLENIQILLETPIHRSKPNEDRPTQLETPMHKSNLKRQI